MKRNIKQILHLTLVSLILFSIITSCEKKETPSPSDPLDPIKKYTLAMMNDIYYWYKDVPQNINPKPINNIFNYFDTLLVPVDRWSWMMTGQEYLSSESGIVETYGISISQPIEYYEDYSIRVRFVHPNSPMAEKGIKRGYELTHLNNTPVMTLVNNGTFNTVFAQKSNSFTFKNHDGESTTFNASARIVSTRSALKTAVYGPLDYPGLQYNVGYFHYMSFKAGMLDDITNAMTTLKNAGVKELILDLRYNGGGDSRATSLLANYLASEGANNKLLAKREHNDKYRSEDSDPSTQTIIERIEGSLNLDRLFILTTKGSASASEVILNGLDPLMNVVHVGTQTYGKPNGMYVYAYPAGDYENPKFVFLPICFFSVNSVGYGHYIDGIVPDYYRPDDLYHDFGLEDDWVNSIMHFITKGIFPELPPKAHQTYSVHPKNKINLPEDNKHYGVYKDNLNRN